jgi:hypothetical protein
VRKSITREEARVDAEQRRTVDVQPAVPLFRSLHRLLGSVFSAKEEPWRAGGGLETESFNLGGPAAG